MFVESFDPLVLVSRAGMGRGSAVSRKQVEFDIVGAQVARLVPALIAPLTFIIHLHSHELAAFTAGAYPTVPGHKTSGREGEDLDSFAFVGFRIKPMDLVVLGATGVVDMARRG
jgi:hypothetical protein